MPSSLLMFLPFLLKVFLEGLFQSPSLPRLSTPEGLFFPPLSDIDFWLQSLRPSITCTTSYFLCPSQFLMTELQIFHTRSFLLTLACLPHQRSAFRLFFLQRMPFLGKEFSASALHWVC